jgi:hypothetical protein
VSRRIVAEITQPVSEQDGTVVFTPGTRLDPDDKRVLALPPGHHRLVVEEVDDPPPPEPPPKPAAASDLLPRPSSSRAKQ